MSGKGYFRSKNHCELFCPEKVTGILGSNLFLIMYYTVVVYNLLTHVVICYAIGL